MQFDGDTKHPIRNFFIDRPLDWIESNFPNALFWRKGKQARYDRKLWESREEDLKAQLHGLQVFLDKEKDILIARERIIKELVNERAAMIAVDPALVVRTEEIIIDQQGRPMRKKILTIGNEQLTPELTRILKEEAAYVKRTMLWGLFQNTIAETARKTMFENSKDFDDIRTGKALLYNLDLQKKIIERILE
jgi:hypothetical protein